MKTIENKIRDFMLNRALPIITNPDSGDYTQLMDEEELIKNILFNEENYGDFLNKTFNEIHIWDKNAKQYKCKCVEKIIKNRKMTFLQLMIFIVKHNVDFIEYSGHYGGGGGLENSCYFYLAVKNTISIDFVSRENIMEENTELLSIIRGAFNYLKGKHCLKYFGKPDIYRPDWIRFNDDYWKIQAELFFKELPPLSNKGCDGRKIGITWGEKCKDCKFLKHKHKRRSYCDFDYYEKYNEIIHDVFLPVNGETYACKHYKKYFKSQLNKRK